MDDRTTKRPAAVDLTADLPTPPVDDCPTPVLVAMTGLQKINTLGPLHALKTPDGKARVGHPHKQSEIHKIERLEAKKNVWADDPSIRGMPDGEMCWAGRCKRSPDGTELKYNARC